MTWTHNGKEFTSEMIGENIGFVYLITDTENGKMYIGKKGLKSVRTLPPLKGEKRKRKKVIETDWKDYCGSNDTIKALVEKDGLDRFKREIIHLCTTKGEMSYIEAKEQFDREVLLYPSRFYNGFIGLKCSRSHIKQLLKE